MATVTIEIQLSSEQLLQAVEQLPPNELSSFVAQVPALRARREVAHGVDANATALRADSDEGENSSAAPLEEVDALLAQFREERDSGSRVA